MKRKIRLLFLVTVSLLVLAGFGKKSVELLSDKKLIDLEAAIAICLPGADSAEKAEGKNPQISSAPTQAPAPSVKPTSTPVPTAIPKPRVVEIRIRDRKVTCGSSQWEDMNALKAYVAKETNSNVTFRLVDDYAEAHVYRQVIAILEELESELGISYTRD